MLSQAGTKGNKFYQTKARTNRLRSGQEIEKENLIMKTATKISTL